MPYLLILLGILLIGTGIWILQKPKAQNPEQLGVEYLLHYQRIIVALTETDRLMKLVDEVGVE